MKTLGFKYFNQYISITLLFVGLYFFLQAYFLDSLDAFIHWPGAYLLSLCLLSLLFFNNKIQRKSFSFSGFSLVYLFSFGIAHFLLSDLLIMVLERFFRLPEHYQFHDLVHKWSSSWYRILEGMFFYMLLSFGVKFLLLIKRDNYNQLFIERSQINTDKAELKALKTELNPHFIFNAMNSVAMTIRAGEAALAVNMIVHINDLLRVVLSNSTDALIELKDELKLLQKYIEIEKIRFGDSVNISMAMDKSTMAVSVPQLILQPIVENAFKHGMIESMNGQFIRMSSQIIDTFVEIIVFNSTVNPIPDMMTTGEGIGLSNVIHRLRYHYKENYEFHVTNKSGGVEIKILIPLLV